MPVRHLWEYNHSFRLRGIFRMPPYQNIPYRKTGDGSMSYPRHRTVPCLATVVRYIHQNPVKAGICKKPQDYNYSSYNEYFRKETLVDCDFVFGMIETDDFIKFNNEKAFEQCLDIEEKPTIRVTDEQAKKDYYEIFKV